MRSAASGHSLGTQTHGTCTGTNGMADLTVDVPADPARSGKLWFEPTLLNNRSVTGPPFATNSRIEVTRKASGVAYSRLLYQGGKTARDAAVPVRQSSDTALAEWMREATALQAGGASDGRLMVQILQGGNDRGNVAMSVGPHPAATGTPAGHLDNLTAIRARLMTAWTAAGYDPAEPNLVVGAHHAQDFDRDRRAASERAAMDFADQNGGVTVIRGGKRVYGSTMLANHWYLDVGGTPDVARMSQVGHEGIGRPTVNQML